MTRLSFPRHLGGGDSAGKSGDGPLLAAEHYDSMAAETTFLTASAAKTPIE